jgi:SNF2 family DNA or RNA helicase
MEHLSSPVTLSFRDEHYDKYDVSHVQKMGFVKFLEFPNEYLHPQFSASYYRRFYGLLKWHDMKKITVGQESGEYPIDESFISHYWILVEMAQSFQKKSQNPSFPFCVFLNYVLETTTNAPLNPNIPPFNGNHLGLPPSSSSIAHPLSYEIWIDPKHFCQYMKQYGTFPFEIFIVNLIKKILSKCRGIHSLKRTTISSDLSRQMLLDVSFSSLQNLWNLKYPLFPHQIESLHWMYRLEKNITDNQGYITINQQSIPISTTGFYYNNEYDIITSQNICQPKSIPFKGGILADITGSGKTATALALIVSTLSLFNLENKHSSSFINSNLYSDLDNQIYFQSQATLIVIPNNLYQQWIEEIKKFINYKNIKIVILKDIRDFKKTTLQNLIEADIVLVTESLLSSKGYSNAKEEYVFHIINSVFKTTPTKHQSDEQKEIPDHTKTQSSETKEEIREFSDQPNNQTINQTSDHMTTDTTDHTTDHTAPPATDPEPPLIREPWLENPSTHLMAWRIASNRGQIELNKKGSVPLESIKWKRIIVDEIHWIINHHGSQNKLDWLTSLPCYFFWGLSGTPMTQNEHIMKQYVKLISQEPNLWVLEFLETLIEKCFHRFEDLNGTPMEKHIYLIEHNEKEKQLLQCFQGDLTIERKVQLCCYFNMVEVDDLNQKIQIMSIEDIIHKVKKDKKTQIKDLESKVKYLDIAVQSIWGKIVEAEQQMKILDPTWTQMTNKKRKREKGDVTISMEEKDITEDTPHLYLSSKDGSSCSMMTIPGNVTTFIPDVIFSNVTHVSPTNQNSIISQVNSLTDIRDIYDVIKSRQKRLNRIVRRKDQLSKEKQMLETGIRYFESKVEDVNVKDLEQCPVCMAQIANVITQCGHLFCRTCIVKCLKKKYQCPICKTPTTPSDAHEIKVDEKNKDTIENHPNIQRYGTKFTKLLLLIQDIIKKNEKTVIYVQWNPLIHAVKEMLKENNIDTCSIIGNTMCQNAAIKKFKTTNTSVLIGSIDNTGLDLVNSNHLIFLHALVGEPYIVKAMEEQAIARIQRQGQTKTVNVYWLITRGTVEEQIYLQTRL